MYIFRKSGLTLASKVWVEGETLTDEVAGQLGVDRWFQENDGRKGSDIYIEYIGQKGVEVKQRGESTNINVEINVKEEKSKPHAEIEKILLEGELTMAQMMGMGWRELVKKFGISDAAKLRNYQKLTGL